MKKNIQNAFNDIILGAKKYELWMSLAIADIRNKNRKFFLGHLWIFLNTILFSVIISFIYSGILGRSFHSYILYSMSGLITWNFLQSLVTEGSMVFSSNASIMKEINLPLSVFVFRIVARNLMIYSINLIVYLVFLAFFGKIDFYLLSSLLIFIPSILITTTCGIFVVTLLGILNSYISDTAQIMNVGMRLMFFITPIMWYTDSLHGFRKLFLYTNPFYYFLELLRTPIMGIHIHYSFYLLSILITVSIATITFLLFAKVRNKIIFWI